MAAFLSASADDSDVVVIGGSLAGSATAASLARRGFRVTVLEKARFPRPKICGEFLSHSALPVLERLGLGTLEDIRASGAETISRFALFGLPGRFVEAPLPSPVLSLSREKLDALVARAAAQHGAAFEFGATVGTVEGDLGRGFVVKGVGFERHARAVVGAWGRYGALDGKLGRPFFGKAASLFGFKKHLTGDSRRLTGRVHLHLFPGGYLGLSRVEGGLVNLAALASPRLAQEAHHDFDDLLARLRSKSPALEADLDGLTPGSGPVLLSEPVHLGARAPVAREVLLVGDAAGVIDPYTGTGMTLALATGEAAAEPLEAFLNGALDASGLLAMHEAKYRAVVGRRFLWSRLFRPFFYGGAASRLFTPAAMPLARLAARLTSGI